MLNYIFFKYYGGFWGVIYYVRQETFHFLTLTRWKSQKFPQGISLTTGYYLLTTEKGLFFLQPLFLYSIVSRFTPFVSLTPLANIIAAIETAGIDTARQAHHISIRAIPAMIEP